MKKKRLLKLIIALTVVVVIVILSSTVFTLKDVELCFYDTNNNLIEDYGAGLSYYTDEDVQDIIDSGNFKYGKSIFFIKRQENIKRIEAEHPYLKVIGISAVFPDGFKIKVVERKPFFSVALANGKYAICDKELKVLEVKDVVSEFDFISLTNLGIESATPGSFITGELGIKTIMKMGDEFASNQYNREGSIKNFEDIRTYEYHFTQDASEKCQNMMIKTRDYGPNPEDGRIAGVTLVIENIAINFEAKLNKLLSFFNNYKDKIESQSGTMKVYDDLKVAYTPSTNVISE